jgi:cobalt-zinc-cadmium efflux system outer membrane protein
MKVNVGRRILVQGLILFSMPGCVIAPLRSAVFPDSAGIAPTYARLSEPVVVQVKAEFPLSTVRAVTDQPIESTKMLSEVTLVDQVLERNPTLAQMTAAWQAAMERIPQAKSWDDPMLGGVIAPSSFNTSQVEPGYRLEVSQKIPFPGKLRLKGQAASAEANASRNDLEDARIQLVEGTRLAFSEYYLTDRALVVNAEALKLLNEFRQNADTRFKTGQAPQQEVFQADVEIGKQNERQLTLERMNKVAKARINALMHLPTNSPLLPPTRSALEWKSLPALEDLQAQAVQSRADLKALADRIAADETAAALAHKEYFPDVEVSGAYDSIMGNGPTRNLAPQVGVKINLPIRLAKRNAAVQEAYHKIAQRRSELASRTDQVNYQVQEAYEQLLESERILMLYDKTILPAAQSNIKAAQAAYLTGKLPFLSLIEAQRNFVNLKDRYNEATADYYRRQANLERAVGGQLASGPVLTRKQ